MFAVGLGIYVIVTRAKDKIGSYGFWAYVIVLLAIYVVNIFSAPPPSAMAVAALAPLVWIFVAWAAWTDRHRSSQ
jgi:FtsH-binding integral membrane protein